MPWKVSAWVAAERDGGVGGDREAAGFGLEGNAAQASVDEGEEDGGRRAPGESGTAMRNWRGGESGGLNSFWSVGMVWDVRRDKEQRP